VTRLSLSLVTAVLLCSCGVFQPDSPENGATQVDVTGTPATTLRFAVIGDFGTGGAVEQAVAQQMCAWRKDHPFDVALTAGDNIYPDGSPSRFDKKFFTPMRCLLEDGVQFYAVLGNHDIMTLQGRAEIHHPSFGMSGRNYVVRMNGVRLVMVDSNNPLDIEWLRDATRAQDGDRWTVVVFHHPVYSPGRQHGSTSRLHDLPDLFVSRGVDLVLNGHDHLYAVTDPLRKIRYVVSGGGGAPLYDCTAKSFVDRCVARNHFLYVIASQEKITVRAIASSGQIFDSFSTLGRDPG
jgi:3',5'-cyclic AMP phosphodiesterase CpdA